jgi:hypothetical protein
MMRLTGEVAPAMQGLTTALFVVAPPLIGITGGFGNGFEQ